MRHPGLSESELYLSLPILSKRDVWDILDAFRLEGYFHIKLIAKTPATTLFSENNSLVDDNSEGLNAYDSTNFDIEKWRLEVETSKDGGDCRSSIDVVYYLDPVCLSQLSNVADMLTRYLDVVLSKAQ